MAHMRYIAPDVQPFIDAAQEFRAPQTLSAAVSMMRQAVDVPVDLDALYPPSRFDAATVHVAAEVGQPLEVVMRRPRLDTLVPAVLVLHSGGLISGNPQQGLAELAFLTEGLDVAMVSVGYRLAPDASYDLAAADCAAALQWLIAEGRSYGIDTARIVLAGSSAGGALAATTALSALGPLHGLMLLSPMLDDRGTTRSMAETVGVGVWDQQWNAIGWAAARSGAEGTVNAPGRAPSLAALPPSYLDVGSAEAMLDEAMDFATAAWRDAIDLELHVWAGAQHGSDQGAPHAISTRRARANRRRWLADRLRKSSGASGDTAADNSSAADK